MLAVVLSRNSNNQKVKRSSQRYNLPKWKPQLCCEARIHPGYFLALGSIPTCLSKRSFWQVPEAKITLTTAATEFWARLSSSSEKDLKWQMVTWGGGGTNNVKQLQQHFDTRPHPIADGETTMLSNPPQREKGHTNLSLSFTYKLPWKLYWRLS